MRTENVEEPLFKCSVCGKSDWYQCRQHFVEEARAQRERAERAESVIMMAGNWPQTVGRLNEALSTFPAGRVFLAQWTASDARASEAFARAHDAETDAKRCRQVLEKWVEYRFCCSDTPAKEKLDKMLHEVEDATMELLGYKARP